MILLAGGVGLALPSLGAASSGDQADDLAPVVVTASRAGAQSLQDIPMSISALVPDELSAKGLSGMSDFLRTVPGVVLNSQDVGVNRITMRGLVSRDINITDLQDRSLVALYLDEIPIGLNMSNPDLRVVEMERVEIIRGPQGTLYGAGSMAGTIRYITKKPDPKQFFGDVDAALSSTQRGGTNWNAKLAANLPLVSDQLALRVGVYRESQDGYIDNIGTGTKNANKLTSTQANAALRWMPTSALTLDASVTYQKLESDGSNGIYRDLGDRTMSLTPVGLNDKLKIFNLTLEYEGAGFDLVSSTSYVDRKFNLQTSLEYLNEAIFGIPMISPSSQLNTIGNFTQEIRVVAKPGKLHWQVGAYYGRDKRHYLQNSIGVGLDQFVGISSLDLYAPLPDEVYYGDIRVEDKQWAVFGEATYQLSDKFELTAGLRYFNFKGPATYFQGGLAGTDAFGLPVALAAEEKASGINPKLVLTYKPNENLMLFAEAARGFRYGGVNYPVPDSFCAASLAKDGLTSAPLTFGPDKVWSYSLGEKGTFADRRMTLNSTAFLINWTNAQTVHPLDCGYPFTENGGKVRSTGFEMESRLKVSSALVVGLNATYTNSESVGGIATINARDGDKVPFFPKWSAAVSADYTWELGSGKLAFGADYSYQGTMGTEFNPTGPNYRTIPSSGIVNASLNYLTGPWEVGLFGTNLTDSDQVSTVIANTLPTQPGDQIFIGRPRTIGLRVKRNF